jgi:type II secretory pathway pseudopilin PulG|tara:strand:+ start:1352 stop:1957 length:606 start_codon:yes stop_codon:yes gene_type:complete
LLGGQLFLHAGGVSLLELLVVLGLVALMAALALPSMLGGLDDARGMAAARHVAGLARLTRVQAAMRSTRVGLRFEREGAAYRYSVYVDGNGNGLRSRDIRRGVDKAITPPERLGERFPGVALGIVPGVAAIDGGQPLAGGTDPIRLGSADTLTFSPLGTATSGTIFLRSRRGRQYAVRVLGATGRTRVLAFRHEVGTWTAR